MNSFVKLFLFLLCCFFAVSADAATDTLLVQLNKSTFKSGDTLVFAALLPYAAQSHMNAATLNVWIDDLATGRRWKYRYPLINGKTYANLAIDGSIPAGHYAVNFVLQRGFFEMDGLIKENNRQTTLNFLMATRQKETYTDKVNVEADRFRLRNLLFEDSAFFVFSPPKKVRENMLQLNITTPLDSSFVPVAVVTKMIDVNPEAIAHVKTDTSKYVFQMQPVPSKGTLPDVVVKTRTKKAVEQFNDEYSTGLFRDITARVFDGIDSKEIAEAPNLGIYLSMKVPGLTSTMNEQGQTVLRWRGSTVKLYLDEFRLDEDLNFINQADIAMIKVMELPPTIAIYTKRGAYGNSSLSKYSFKVNGYTPQETDWKN